LERSSIKGVPRETGKSSAKKLRREGYVPAILYGHGVTPLPLAVVENEMVRLLREGRGSSSIIDLYVDDGDPRTVIVKDLTQDPIQRRIAHVDFQQISLTEEIQASVSVVLVGEDVITKKGLIVQHQTREVEVKCLPTSIPERFAIDVSEMDVGDLVRVGDLGVPSDVKLLTDSDEVVLSVLAPKRVEEPEEEEAVEEGEEPVEEEKEEE
jgi:large subunit ribosomal protein L25